MCENIELMLMSQHAELYLSIKKKCIDELKLPMILGNSIIGFGKLLDFYMFWISEKKGTLYFCARKEFTRTRKDNSVKIEFTDSNKDEIFKAIDEIYHSFLCASANGSFQQAQQRYETNKSLRATIAKNKEIDPDIMLLWNDLTVCVFEKATEDCNLAEIDTNARARFRSQGQYIAVLFDSLMCLMVAQLSDGVSRKLSVYREYIESDSTTLADIAPQYQVSRERIRQIVNRADKLLFEYFKKMMLFDNEEFNEQLKQLASALASIEYDFIGLIVYGFTEINDRKKHAFFNMLFGKTFSQEILDKGRSSIKIMQEQDRIAKEENDLLAAWKFYQSKICYPSDFVVDSSLPIGSYKQELSFDFETRLYKKIKNFEPMIEIVLNPDIVYYSTSTTDHRPQFFLRLPNGTSVLVLVLPTVNMAFIYNVKRCNALHLFCRENGYGYLIMDDHGNSIYDIKKRAVDGELVARLNTVLNRQNMIVWSDIKEIKLTCPVSNADIAAYVLQNKLHFTMEPFCIKRRK